MPSSPHHPCAKPGVMAERPWPCLWGCPNRLRGLGIVGALPGMCFWWKSCPARLLFHIHPYHCACAWLRIRLLPASQDPLMDMRPQNPALCSPQGTSPPWKARAGAGGVSPGSPSVISCSRGCSCCSRAVLRAGLTAQGGQHSPVSPRQRGSVRSRDKLLPCHAGGRWSRRTKALGAGCSPPQLPTGCSPRGPSAGWRPYMASRPTRGRDSHTGSPCPGKGPRALSPAAPAPPPPPHGAPSPGDTQGPHPGLTAEPPGAAATPFFPRPDGAFQSHGSHGTPPARPGSISAASAGRRDGRQHRPGSPRPSSPAGPPPHGRWDARPPPCTVPGGSERFQTTFSGRHGPGSQARRPGRSPPPRFPQPSFPPLPLSALMTSTWASGSPSQASQHCLKSPNLEEI